MFYLVEMSKTIDVEPRYFGAGLKTYLQKSLRDKMEGVCSGKFGYIICITGPAAFKPGVLRTDGSGKAEFEANFSCIVMRPFKGEIMDCVVTSVNNMGFFADAGPLVIFVSSHLIPEDLTYTAIGSDSSFANADQSVRIVEGTHVRLRIVGARIDQQDIFCIGTIKEDYLGVIGTLV